MSILRLIDANANRAREGLRVVEDYARFVLDDEPLCAEIKSIRHLLADALGGAGGILAHALIHRDVTGDVGVAVKTHTELARQDLAHVVTAAAKRVGEALRSLEEYLKIDHPHASRHIEAARYRFYTLEQRIALTLRPSFDKLQTARLYVLITESACKLPWFQVARAAVTGTESGAPAAAGGGEAGGAAGGADILQLREKDLESAELLRRARELAKLCRDYGVLLIINDRPDIALLADADGVHVGQGDLPPLEARRIVGPGKIVGVSTHHLAHAHQARLDGADYIGAGPTFRSPTKPRDIDPGLPYLRQLAAFPLPAFAIAGITHANLPQVLATGVHRVAVTAAITQSHDPAKATRELREMLYRPTPPSP